MNRGFTPDGNIYRLDGSRFVPVLDTGCSSIQNLTVSDRLLWNAGIDPDRLFVMSRGGCPVRVAKIPGETSADHARSFGAAATVRAGDFHLAAQTAGVRTCTGSPHAVPTLRFMASAKDTKQG